MLTCTIYNREFTNPIFRKLELIFTISGAVTFLQVFGDLSCSRLLHSQALVARIKKPCGTELFPLVGPLFSRMVTHFLAPSSPYDLT